MRQTSFCFRVKPNAEMVKALRRHVGAKRFAYNHCVARFLETGEKRKEDPTCKGPVSGYDFINDFNAWKKSSEAGVDATGKPGLAWQSEIYNQVFEEGCVDAGRASKAFLKTFKKTRNKKGKVRAGPPRFKKRGRARTSFRIRNAKGCIQLNESTLRLPKIGELPITKSTRQLRRMLRQRDANTAPRARILFVTVFEVVGKWYVRINVKAAPFHPLLQKNKQKETVGIDLGLNALAVVASADGEEQARWDAPKHLRRAHKRLARLSREHSRKKAGSRNRGRLRARIAKLHHHVANRRRAYLHDITAFLAKNQRHVAVEDLHIIGMLKHRCLARSISDAGWGILSRQLAYKAEWYNCKVTRVDRFYPSSKTCCACNFEVEAMPLKERVFRCKSCLWEADRDTNAAANLARWAENVVLRAKPKRKLKKRKLSVESIEHVSTPAGSPVGVS